MVIQIKRCKKYRVKAYCKKCNRYWTTKAKKDASTPSRCKFCGSSKTKTKTAWRVKKLTKKVGECPVCNEDIMKGEGIYYKRKHIHENCKGLMERDTR